MGVYIKWMEMPTKCADCLFIDYFKGQWYCHSINDILETGTSKRDERCNLVPVPPHGRLIDADALKAYINDWGFIGESCAIESVDNAPTIIEAEEGET